MGLGFRGRVRCKLIAASLFKHTSSPKSTQLQRFLLKPGIPPSAAPIISAAVKADGCLPKGVLPDSATLETNSSRRFSASKDRCFSRSLNTISACSASSRSISRWHFLYFLPLPHWHGAFRCCFGGSLRFIKFTQTPGNKSRPSLGFRGLRSTHCLRCTRRHHPIPHPRHFQTLP